MSGTSDGRPGEVHGPCERCGVVFTSGATTCRPMCPNCGHRVLSDPLPSNVAGIETRVEAKPADEDVLEVSLRAPRTCPFTPPGDARGARWRLN